MREKIKDMTREMREKKKKSWENKKYMGEGKKREYGKIKIYEGQAYYLNNYIR